MADDHLAWLEARERPRGGPVLPAGGTARKGPRVATVTTSDGLLLLLVQRSPGGRVYDVTVKRSSKRLGSVEKILSEPKSWKAFTPGGHELARVGTMQEAAEYVLGWTRRQIERQKAKAAA